MPATPTHILWGRVTRRASASNTSSGDVSKSSGGSHQSQRPASAPSAGGAYHTAVIGNKKIVYPSYVQFEESSSASTLSGSRSQPRESSMTPSEQQPQAKDCKEAAARPDQAASIEVLGSTAAAARPSQARSTSAAAGPSQVSQEALASIPRDENGKISSLGSIPHVTGTCKPCIFVRAGIGCQNGVRCEFCHLTHQHKSKPRPCKGKRDRYRKLILRAESEGIDYRGLMQQDIREVEEMAKAAQTLEQAQAPQASGSEGRDRGSSKSETPVSITVVSL
mmetsp:Transcript_60186/g.193782  ORF Transcript_60186/g.193782 Transcript_60186/m.193782 type:complete len:279 (+) Transcript_60186:147-983(+)